MLNNILDLYTNSNDSSFLKKAAERNQKLRLLLVMMYKLYYFLCADTFAPSCN